MLRIAASLAIVAALVVSVQGCNSGYGNSVSTSPCVLPSGLQAALVYPAANSTGNTVTLPQVIVGTNATLPASWDVVLTFPFSTVYGNTRFGNTVTTAPTPFPTPFQTPSFSNPNYYASAFAYVTAPPLPPGTVITATLNDTSSSCYPGVTLANFST